MKKSLFFSAIIVYFFMLFFIFASCNNPDGGGGIYTVRYLITGPQIIADHVSYSNETGNFDSITNVPIPWEKTITVQGHHGISCSATIYFVNNITYTAKIFINGKETYSASSSSNYVSVTGITQ